jgi:hypothetical protein
MWKYGRFESFPCVYDEDDQRGFVLFDENYGWREISYVEITHKAGMMSKSAFETRYPNLPPIPSAALSGE